MEVNGEDIVLDEKWGVLENSLLFEAILESKPAGVLRNFQMMRIIDKLNSRTFKFLPTPAPESTHNNENPKPSFLPSEVWTHLAEYFNLAGMEANEKDVFYWPDFYNQDMEFDLPADYNELKQKCPERTSGENPLNPPNAPPPHPPSSGSGKKRKRQNSGGSASNSHSRSSTPSGHTPYTRKELRRS